MRRRALIALLLLSWALETWTGAVTFASESKPPPPLVTLPKTAFGPEDLAVIVNDADTLSVGIARYYQVRRRIPDDNMIHIRFAPGKPVMAVPEFRALKARVDAATPERVQAYALTWAAPYRVGCMSITTAFAAGFDPDFCAQGCAPTRISPYFNSNSLRPFGDFELRPTMSLAARSLEEARVLIDRGVASDHTWPAGTGYLVDTSDRNRNVRAGIYATLIRHLGGVLQLDHVKADTIEDRPDVLFYFTGLPRVAHLKTNTFLPGAIADHLTSTGGRLTDSKQMSSLRWLEAGATASYGTVVEPCNLPAKFPNPAVVIARYVNGETLIEAYWKSVAMPGQGIFIGEPLAAPFASHRLSFEAGQWILRTHSLSRGRYAVLAADSGVGPYRPVKVSMRTEKGVQEIGLGQPVYRYYRVVRRPDAR